MSFFARLSGLLIFLWLCCGQAIANDVSSEVIRQTVEHLSTDEMAGRFPSSEGSRQAAKWLAEQLDSLGLETVRNERIQAFGQMQNVLGMLPGSGEETLVIGAHYDHLGVHSNGVFNGADDNASGCAAVLAIAEALVRMNYQPKRNIVFAFFDGEEKGKKGSLHYLSIVDTPYMIERHEPPALMLNFDMVGRMRDRRVQVLGVKTAPYWSRWLRSANDLDIQQTALSGFNSDHLAFLAYGSPVLHFFTGYHDDYHTIADESALINFDGIGRVANLGLSVLLKADAYAGALQSFVNSEKPFSVLAAEKLGLTHRLQHNRR